MLLSAETRRNAEKRGEVKKLTTKNTEITKSYPDGAKWQENGGQKDKDRNGNIFAPHLFA
jgi:hypothetical protein